VREDLLRAVRRFTGVALGRCESTSRLRTPEAPHFFFFACAAVPWRFARGATSYTMTCSLLEFKRRLRQGSRSICFWSGTITKEISPLSWLAISGSRGRPLHRWTLAICAAKRPRRSDSTRNIRCGSSDCVSQLPLLPRLPKAPPDWRSPAPVGWAVCRPRPLRREFLVAIPPPHPGRAAGQTFGLCRN